MMWVDIKSIRCQLILKESITRVIKKTLVSERRASAVKGPMCFISKEAQKVVVMEGKDLRQQRLLFCIHSPLQDVLVTARPQVEE